MANVGFPWRKIEKLRIAEILLWWFTRIIREKFSQKRIGLDIGKQNQIEYLAFVSGSQFQTTTSERAIAEKVDPVLDSLERSGLHGLRLIHPFSTSPKKPPLNPYLKSEGLINIFDAIRIIFGLKTKRYEMLFETLRLGRFDFTYKLHAAANFEVMNQVKPRFVIGIGLSDIQVTVAHGLGIYCVELQHGAYYKGAQIARFISDQNPDLFLVWDSESALFINNQGLTAVNIGHPHLQKLKPTPQRSNLAPYVLVSLSYDETPSHDPFKILHPDIHWALLELGKLGIPHKIRFHPFVDSSPHLGPRDFPRAKYLRKYFGNKYPTAILSFPSERSLLQDLRNSFLHITYASSSIIESSFYGVRTIHFGLPDNELINLDRLIQCGLVRSVDKETFHEHLALESLESMPKDLLEELSSEIVIRALNSLLSR